jgi:hypothetical protein
MQIVAQLIRKFAGLLRSPSVPYLVQKHTVSAEVFQEVSYNYTFWPLLVQNAFGQQNKKKKTEATGQCEA